MDNYYELLLFFLFSLPFFFFFLRSRSRLPLPPGPKPLPIIGNMHMMDQLTHRGLAKLSNQFGGLVYIKLGVLHTFAVSTPEVARQILQDQDNVFLNRPATVAARYLTYDRADMAFGNYGPFWHQMRKLCMMKVFSRKRAESGRSVREEVDSMLVSIASKAGTEVDIGANVFALTRNIMYRAAFGSSSQERQEEFVMILQEFSKLMGGFNIVDFIPWMRWIDPHGFKKRLVKARRALDGFIDRIIDDRMAKVESKCVRYDDDTDMVDDLLAFVGEFRAQTGCGGQDSIDDLKLSRANIKALVMDVMFGGTETVASAIEWAMAELMKSPQDMRRVQEELRKSVGLERKVDETDLENLTYLKCCIKETLRLHPPIPLLLHETAADCQVSGYRIPAGSRVSINLRAIGRDPTVWEDPETFKPSRFEKEGAVDFKGNHFELIPFGSGRRSCPGMQLGLYALELAVAQLMHSFEWALPDGMTAGEMDMSDVFGLTAPKAARLVAIPTPRLVCSLV